MSSSDKDLEEQPVLETEASSLSSPPIPRRSFVASASSRNNVFERQNQRAAVDSSLNQVFGGRQHRTKMGWMKLRWVVFLGVVACVATLAVGISGEKDKARQGFHVLAGDLVQQAQSVMNDYLVQATWIHQACSAAGDNYTVQDFLVANEYVSCMNHGVLKVRMTDNEC